MIADARLNHRLSWSYLLLLATFALLPCLPVSAGGEGLKLADCPKPVQKTIRHEVGSGRILEIEKISKDGKALYEIDVQIEKDVYELQLSPQGKLLAKMLEDDDVADGKDEDEKDADDDDEDEDEDDKVTLKLEDLPRAVRKTLKQETRGGDIEELEREIEDGRIIYSAEVEFETEAGEVVYEIEIAENGVLLSKVLEDDEDEDDEEDRD